MNLKEAAHELGVHYQTAYKWVRSGELPAVRLGSRYEVAPAAIDHFLASRRTVAGADAAAAREARRTSDLHPEDMLEELEAMLDEPMMTVASVTGFAARRGAEVLGDMCFVIIRDENGVVQSAAIEHPWADRAAFGTATLGIIGGRLVPEHQDLRDAIQRGQTVRLEHLDPSEMLALYRGELSQYLQQYPICSFVAAPILAGDDVIGVVAFTRDDGEHPYTVEDEQLAARMGRRVGRLVRNADATAAAWALRDELAHTVREHLELRAPGRPLTAAEVQELLFAPGSPAEEFEFPVLVVDARKRTLGVNSALNRIGRFEPGTTIDLETTFEPDRVEAEDELFQRLVSGEIDYHDFHAVRIRADGTPIAAGMHRVAVREHDATFACVITVAVTRDADTPTPAAPDQEAATSTHTGR